MKCSGNTGRVEETVAGDLPRALTLPAQREASLERCLLPYSVLWMKPSGWHLQWALLPSELSTHRSHLRNDSCEELLPHGWAQQKAVREEKSRSPASGFT